MQTKNQLRFAALIRVSTERQAAQGESLQVQLSTINRDVERLGGVIVAQYGGQEHATPGWEKTQVQRLLEDSQRKPRPFDAVIVAHADRWSRDNEASQNGLTLFRKSGVRFFVSTTEYALQDPHHLAYLEMSAVFGGFQARTTRKRSLESRIERARKGYPSCGKLPYGRTFNEQSGEWEIDKEKQRVIEGIARRYINNESTKVLAAELGVNRSNLHRTLTTRCGSTWVQEFKSEELGIHERVETEVPALLSADLLKAVRERVERNKTFDHGQIRNRYLLGRMVFCKSCGHALVGQTIKFKDRNTRFVYYRHLHPDPKCPFHTLSVPATRLEDAVVSHLFSELGNPAGVRRAIEAAVPNLDAQRQLQGRITDLGQLIARERDGKQKVLELVKRGRVSLDEADESLKDAQARISHWEEERERLSVQAVNTPTAEKVRKLAHDIASKYRRVPKAFVRANAAACLAASDSSRMTWEDKRELLKQVFGDSVAGQRAGVYVEWPKGAKRTPGKPTDGIRYCISGAIRLSDVLERGLKPSNAWRTPTTTSSTEREPQPSHPPHSAGCFCHRGGSFVRAARRRFPQAVFQRRATPHEACARKALRWRSRAR